MNESRRARATLRVVGGTPGRRPSAPALRGGWPLAGHLPAFQRDRLRLLAACGRAGDAVSLRLGPWPATVFSHPDLVREVLVGRQDAFRKSPALRAARVVLGDGLLTSEGETHRRHRRLVQPAIGLARLPHLGGSVDRQLGHVTAGWQGGEVVDVHAALRRFSLGVAAETLFGADLERDATALSGWLDDLLEAYENPQLALARFVPWLPLPSFRRWQAARRGLGDLVRDRVVGDGARRERDVLTALRRARDERGTMSAAEVHDEVVTLLLAGHETTASTLAWTLWLLAADPEVAACVAEEASAVGNGHAGLPSAVEAVEALPWARAVVAESLRLYPPSWAMGRQALTDVQVGDHLLPRGSLAITSQWIVQRDPRWWPRPSAFVPSRWLGGTPEGLHPFAYFPFGGGRRRCVGEPIAWAEAVLAVALLCRRWQFVRVPGAAVRPRALLTLRPAGPVPLCLVPR